MTSPLYLLTGAKEGQRVAAACGFEAEDVLIRAFGAIAHQRPSDFPADISGCLVFCICLRASDVEARRRDLNELKQRGATVVLYVFDAWALPGLFFNGRRRIKSRFIRSLRLDAFCDVICVPFTRAAAALEPLQSEVRVLHVPLAVDTSLSEGTRSDRSLQVFAYGRQPGDVMDALALRYNQPGGSGFMYHTDHMRIDHLSDYRRHRRMFWALAERSQIALAYDHLHTPVGAGPDYSFVGQRWFESLAAGCVVVGRRPQTEEFDELFDWPDPSLEAPDQPKDVCAMIADLLGKPDTLDEMRQRNITGMRAAHDWRHRFELILTEMGQRPPDGASQTVPGA